MILIDGDIIVYQSSAYYEETIVWDDSDIDVVTYPAAAKKLINDKIQNYMDTLEETECLVVFSDKHNFRKDLMPTYKQHRKAVQRPRMIKAMQEYVDQRYNTVTYKNLEADDTLGILCTLNPEWIVVTIDKDQAVVPGKWYNPIRTEWGIRVIDKEEADYNHMVQTLTGDTSDGYKGVPGVGPKKAERILGSLKGNPRGMWRAVLEAYASKGLSEKDALLNARMAYILRSGDYNVNTGEVILWGSDQHSQLKTYL